MTPGARLDLIKAIRPVLFEMTTADVCLHVREFGDDDVMSWDHWLDNNNSDNSEEWIVYLLRSLDDGALVALGDYVLAAGPTIDQSNLPWRDGELRLFLSHIAREKEFLSALATALDRFGFHGFVAHEHIDPGRE